MMAGVMSFLFGFASLHNFFEDLNHDYSKWYFKD